MSEEIMAKLGAFIAYLIRDVGDIRGIFERISKTSFLGTAINLNKVKD